MKTFSASLLASDSLESMRENTAAVTLDRSTPTSMIAVQAENAAAYNEALIKYNNSFLGKVLTESTQLSKNDEAIHLMEQVVSNMNNVIAAMEGYTFAEPTTENILSRFDTFSNKQMLETMREEYPQAYQQFMEAAFNVQPTISRMYSGATSDVAEKYQDNLNKLFEAMSALNEYVSLATFKESSDSIDEAREKVQNGIDSILESFSSMDGRSYYIDEKKMQVSQYLKENHDYEPTNFAESLDFSNVRFALKEFSELADRAYKSALSMPEDAVRLLRRLENCLNSIGTSVYSINECAENCAINNARLYNIVVESTIRIADGNSLQKEEMDSYAMDQWFTEFYAEVDATTDRLNRSIQTYRNEAIIKESSIMEDSSMSASEKTLAMQSLNEAIGQKVKKAWNNTLEMLKTLFNKFLEKLRANLTTTKHYLDQYKSIILEKNYDNTEYKTQDLETGIKHVLNATIPALNMNDIGGSNGNGENPLTSVGTYFEKKIKPNLPDIGSKDPVITAESSLADITEFWKSYFCMQNHEMTITGGKFQTRVNYYYDFLYDISKIERACRKTLKDVENSVNEIMKSAGTEVGNAGNNAGGTQTQESFYSYIRGAQVFFELKINNPAQQQNNQPAQPQQPKSTTNADNLKNVEGNRDNANDDQTIKSTQKSLIDQYCTNYVNNASAMMKAKMSACEFIRNEAMGIIRNHVKSYVGNKATGEDNTGSSKIQDLEEKIKNLQASKKGKKFREKREIDGQIKNLQTQLANTRKQYANNSQK